MVVSVLQPWLRVQAVLWGAWCIAAAVDASFARPSWIALAMGASYASLVGILRAGRRVADIATIVRVVLLLAALAAGQAAPELRWWAVLVVAVFLDLVDGALARRFGATAEGAILDMESDQFTVLALSMVVVAQGGAPHVLVLPGLRYAFVLAMWWLSIPAHDPKPVNGDNRRGRRVCATVMIALLAATFPGAPPVVRDGATLAASVLLAWSFSGDARHLLARRRAAGVRA
ncbi:MAG: CDP-alcohol phosphatidyltransferase family protein [Planctomycetes bacterium]|nr:CDP-alcohol phosphatidyltransferase family protein [Planctomycetota bacterium]